MLVKEGTLLLFKKTFLSKKWKLYYGRLHDSGLLECYESATEDAKFSICFKTVASKVRIGKFTKQLDIKGRFSPDEYGLLMTLPIDFFGDSGRVAWVKFRDLSDLRSWVKAIITTVPNCAQILTQYRELFPASPVPVAAENKTNFHENKPAPIGFEGILERKSSLAHATEEETVPNTSDQSSPKAKGIHRNLVAAGIGLGLGYAAAKALGGEKRSRRGRYDRDYRINEEADDHVYSHSHDDEHVANRVLTDLIMDDYCDHHDHSFDYGDVHSSCESLDERELSEAEEDNVSLASLVLSESEESNDETQNDNDYDNGGDEYDDQDYENNEHSE